MMLACLVSIAGCATTTTSEATKAATAAAAAELAAMQERVQRELPTVPSTGFVDFVDGGGLKIGGSIVGDTSYRFSGGTNTVLFAAEQHDGVGVASAVVTGFANSGAGDLYDDALVYSCFTLSIDLSAQTVLGYDDLLCPRLVTDSLDSGQGQLSFDDLST